MARGLFAGHHIGDSLSFIEGPLKDKKFILRSHDFYEDIRDKTKEMMSMGYRVSGLWLRPNKMVESKEQITDSCGRILVLEGDPNCIVIIYGPNKYDTCGPSSFGMRYTNCPEMYPIKPQDLGLDDGKERSREEIKKTVVDKIVRLDSDKSLKGYLSALTCYFTNDEPKELKKFIREIYSDKLDGLPVSQIQKNFGEVLAPLAILSKNNGLFSEIGLSSKDKVCYPVSKTQDMVDFYIVKNGVRYYFSSKSGIDVSNTIKPSNIVPSVESDEYLIKKYKDRLEYKVMSCLHHNTAVDGPMEAALLLKDKIRRFRNITQEIVTDWKSKSSNKGSAWEMSEIYEDLVSDLDCDRNFGSILYVVEKMIGKSSVEGRVLDYTSLFSEIAGSRVNYINLESIDIEGLPIFKTIHAYFPKVKLRTKNSAERIGADKIGIQVIS